MAILYFTLNVKYMTYSFWVSVPVYHWNYFCVDPAFLHMPYWISGPSLHLRHPHRQQHQTWRQESFCLTIQSSLWGSGQVKHTCPHSGCHSPVNRQSGWVLGPAHHHTWSCVDCVCLQWCAAAGTVQGAQHFRWVCACPGVWVLVSFVHLLGVIHSWMLPAKSCVWWSSAVDHSHEISISYRYFQYCLLSLQKMLPWAEASKGMELWLPSGWALDLLQLWKSCRSRKNGL